MLKFLKCRRDAAHKTFKGFQHVCCEYIVDLDSSANPGDREFSETLEDLTDPSLHQVRCATCGDVAWRPLEPISFPPSAGEILMCDFSTGFQKPEMVKVRPAVIISERTRNRQTCVVVAISTVEAHNDDALVVQLDQATYPFLDEDSSAKCDMIYSVRRGRLYRLRDHQTGRGIDSRQTAISTADLQLVRAKAAKAIGLP